MKGLSRKKFLPGRQKFLAASHSTHPKPFNANHHAAYGPFLYCLCLSPIRIVVAVVSFEKLPTMVLFATPAPCGAGPMTISGYAWGHIVATGPQQLPGHPLP